VRQLERPPGVRLFQRSTRQRTLGEEGQRLLDTARTSLGNLSAS
jgi:DNA-binding transcriptional LysR family regulator